MSTSEAYDPFAPLLALADFWETTESKEHAKILRRRIAETREALGEVRCEVEWGVVGGPGNRDSKVHTYCLTPSGTNEKYNETLAKYDGKGEHTRRRVTTTITHRSPWERP